MRAYLPAVAVAAGLVAGCSEVADQSTSVRVSPAKAEVGMARRPVSTPPGAGERLFAYDRSTPAVRRGAAVWHPIHLNETRALAAIGKGAMEIPAPDGQRIQLKFQRHVEHPSGNWTWVGRDEGSGRQAVLTFGEKAVFGSITGENGEALQVTTSQGRTWLVEADGRLLREELREADFLLGPQTSRRGSAPLVTSASARTAKAGASAKAGTTVDIVLGYTTGFAARLGGQSQARTRLDYLVALTNQAYADSGVDGEVRVVQTVQVDYPDASSNTATLFELTGVSCVANNNGSVRLPDLGQNCTPATRPASLQPLVDAREQFGADLVSLVRVFTAETGSCGVGWLLGAGQTPIDAEDADFAFSVVGDTNGNANPVNGTACREEYLAHEMGHNMGLQHDRQSAQASDDTNDDGNLLDPEEFGALPYTFGHSTGTDAGNFYTVMSIRRPGQTGFKVFSNPRITLCANQPCGVADMADNARGLGVTMPLVASFRTGTVPLGPADSDFNGDGVSDVLWRNTNDGRNVVWRSASSATPQAVTAVTAQAWKVAGVGDFNGDGVSDVLWRNGSDGKNAIWRSANSATPQAVATVASQAWKIAGVGDFNGDGQSDILWRNTTDGKNAIWRSGNSATPQAVSTVPLQSWQVAGVGDFNGDGLADILWRNNADGKNVIWRSGGSATAQAVATVPVSWQVAGVGDFNGDGVSDILWRNTVDGKNVVWRSGSSTAPQAVSQVPSQAWKVAKVGDFDGDGVSDILWRLSTDGRNVIWRSGNSATQQAVTTVPTAWLVAG